MPVQASLKFVVFFQLVWAVGGGVWNVAGVIRLASGHASLGPPSSIVAAALLIAAVPLFLLGIRRYLLLYVALCLACGLAAAIAFHGAFTLYPAVWPSELCRMCGAALNAVGLVSCVVGLILAFRELSTQSRYALFSLMFALAASATF